MGLFSKIGKFLKKSVKNSFRGGSTFEIIDKKITKPVNAKIQDAIGIGALKDMAAGQAETLRLQGERAKLDANSEIDNVTQFDDSSDVSFVGSSERRKKKSAGSFASNIGLNI